MSLAESSSRSRFVTFEGHADVLVVAEGGADTLPWLEEFFGRDLVANAITPAPLEGRRQFAHRAASRLAALARWRRLPRTIVFLPSVAWHTEALQARTALLRAIVDRLARSDGGELLVGAPPHGAALVNRTEGLARGLAAGVGRDVVHVRTHERGTFWRVPGWGRPSEPHRPAA